MSKMASLSFSSSLSFALLCLFCLFSNASCQAVFAHVVAGNSGSYSSQDWLNDITLAKSSGFDGFVMNIAPNTYNLGPMLDLTYAAAQQVGFKIFLSFDYVGGTTPWPADQVSSLISNYANNPAQYLWTDGRPVVTTFQGCDNLNDWPTIKSQTNCFFIPNYSCLGPAAGVNAPGVDGLAAWDDAAWPVGPTNITTGGDENYLNALSGKPYMMPVSPWFFRDVYGDNWLWRGDSLWYDRWNQVAQIKPAIVQVITWNDYGESHYVGPLPPDGTNAIPDGATYVANNTHDAWLGDLPYFVAQYKGTPVPQTEHITMWSRLNPSTSGGSGGTVGNAPDRGQPLFPPADLAQDIISINVLAASNGTVVGGVNGQVSLNANVVAGMNHFTMPFDGWPGVPTVTLQRNGQTVISVQGAMIEAPADGTVNWNAYVTGSGTSTASRLRHRRRHSRRHGRDIA